MKIYLASDHAGFELKEKIKEYLLKKNIPLEDMGTHSNDAVNWAEYGAKAAQKVSENPEEARGIIVCGSGLGMSIVCNKFRNVRAALCNDEYAAEMSRRHNNANVLNIGGRVVEVETALKVVELWLNTPFDGGRHQKRLDFITNEVESRNFK
jgi:ribose 5-phosphate isomerase B